VIADWIRDAVDGPQPLVVYDRSTDSYRAARYGDIAILSNTRNPFPAFERGLADLGIPFVKDGGREFFSGREVQDILAALRVIDNPLDDVSLLTASDRRCSDGAIAISHAFALRHEGVAVDGLRGSNPKGPRIHPYQTIRRLRRRRLSHRCHRAPVRRDRVRAAAHLPVDARTSQTSTS
jgi:hypothetical protein